MSESSCTKSEIQHNADEKHHSTRNIINLTKPLTAADVQLGQQKEIHLEFIKLYRNSRNALHNATETPSETMPHNIAYILDWSSKLLNQCFDKADAYKKEIEHLVNERLTPTTTTSQHYTVPKTDSASIDIYINSRNRPLHEVGATSPPPTQKWTTKNN